MSLKSIYEKRHQHAEANLKFWNGQWCERPDAVAQSERDAAYRGLSDIRQEIARINKPRTLVYEPFPQ